MNKELKEELALHVQDAIIDGVITDENQDEWHHLCFNQDFYIIGYWECQKWLSKHKIDTVEAINFCKEYQKNNFGEIYTSFDNYETIVNNYAYIIGEEFLNECESNTIKELKEKLTDILN